MEWNRWVGITAVLCCALVGTNANHQPGHVQCQHAIDLCFILDSSDGVSAQGWIMTKLFVAQMVDSFLLGSTMARVGVVTFSTTGTLDIGLGVFSTQAEFRLALQALQRRGGPTNTATGLNTAANQCFRSTADRPSAPNVAVFITDGQPTTNAAGLPAAILNLHSTATLVASMTVTRTAPNTPIIAQVARRSDTQIPVLGLDYFRMPSYPDLTSLAQRILSVVCMSTGPTPAPPMPPGACQKGIDLCFVLDSSNSLKPEGWRATLEFVSQIVGVIRVSYQGSSVGVVTFSEIALLNIQPGAYHDRAALQEAIGRLAFLNGKTDTALGLNVAATQCFLPIWDRADTSNVVIFISDGMPNVNVDKRDEALRDLKRVAHSIVSFGIGPSVSESMLQEISKRSDGGLPQHNQDYYTSITNIDLAGLANHVQGNICPPPVVTPTCQSSINVLFLLDRSGSETHDGWLKVQRGAVQLVDLFRKRFTNPYYGVIAFSDDAREFLPLSLHTAATAQMTIQGIDFANGNSNLAAALNAAANTYSSSHFRPSSYNIAVVMTDGNATLNPTLVPAAVHNLHTITHRVLTLGYGPNIIQAVLHQIARRSDDVTILPDTAALQNIVSRLACQAPATPAPFTPAPFTPAPFTPPPPPLPNPVTPVRIVYCQARVDVCMVLDKSGSINNRGWIEIKNYALYFLPLFRRFGIYPNVGVVSFADYAYTDLELDTYSENQLYSTINNIRWADGYTDIGHALTTAATRCFRTRGDRSDAFNLAIVISDGDATHNQGQTDDGIRLLHMVAHRVLVVGTGVDVRQDRIRDIAQGRGSYLINPAHQQLDDLIGFTAQEACVMSVTPAPTPFPIVCTGQLDVCLILDRSGSEMQSGWARIQQMAADVVDLLRASRGQSVSFGVVTFSDYPYRHLDLNSHDSFRIRDVIRGVPFANGYTDLAGGLRVGATECFKSGGDRRNAKNVAIVITDANATVNILNVPRSINELHESTERVIAIAYGPNISFTDIQNIARRPGDVYIRPSRGDLQRLVTDLQRTACEAVAPLTPAPPGPLPVCGQLVDICLLLDRSGSETPSGWRQVQATAVNLVSELNTLSQYPYIGLVTFSDFAEPRLSLGRYDVSYIQSLITSVPFADGYTDVPGALRLAANTCFRNSNRRRNAKAIAILISDGNETLNSHDLGEAIRDLHSVSDRVYTIGVGPNVVRYKLTSISIFPQYTYTTTDTQTLQHLVGSIAALTCPSQPQPQPQPRPDPLRACSTSLDVCLVLDIAQNLNDWVKLKDFTYELVRYLSSSNPPSYIGVVLFSGVLQLAVPLGPQRPNMQYALRDLAYMHGNTITAEALRYTARTCFTNTADRPNNENVVIFISEGEPFSYSDVGAATGELKSRVHTLLPVGIGSRISQNLLHSLAKPRHNRAAQPGRDYLTAPDYNNLNTLLPGVLSAVCPTV